MPLPLQTFVYLFAPICGHIRESDFMQNARLENGRRVWQALWEFRHPDIECFTAQVRIASRCQCTLAGHQGPRVQGAGFCRSFFGKLPGQKADAFGTYCPGRLSQLYQKFNGKI